MSKNREDQNITQILEIIQDPSWTREDVKQALKEHSGNVDVVVNKIVEGKISPWEKVNRKKSGAEVQKIRFMNKVKSNKGGSNRGGKTQRPPRQSESNTDKPEVANQETKTEQQNEDNVSAPLEQHIEKSIRQPVQRKTPAKPIETPAPVPSTQTTQGFSFADAVAQNTKPKESESKETPADTEKPTRGATRGRGRGRGGFQKREFRPQTQQIQKEEPKPETTVPETTESKPEVSESVVPQVTPVQQPEQQVPQQATPQQIPVQYQQQQVMPQQPLQAQAQPQPQPQAQAQPQAQPQGQPQGQYNEGLQMPFNLNTQSTTNVRFGSFQDQQLSEQWKQPQQASFFSSDYSRQQGQRPQDKDDEKKGQEGYGARPQPINQGMYYPYGNPGMNPGLGVQGNSYLHHYYQMLMQFPQYGTYQQQGQKQFPSYTPNTYNKNVNQTFPQFANQMMQPHLQQGQDTNYQYYGYQQVSQNQNQTQSQSQTQTQTQNQKEEEQNGHTNNVPQMGFPPNPYGNFYPFFPPQGHHDSQK